MSTWYQVEVTILEMLVFTPWYLMAIHFSRLPGMDGNGDFQALFIRKDLGFPSSN